MGMVSQNLIARLKSRSEENRAKAAKELNHYVLTELREVSAEDAANFMDEMNHHIFEMVSSVDINERKGGILAIVSLIGVDVGNTSTRTSRFANYLRNLLPSNDLGVMQMAAKAIGRLALASGTYTSEFVEFEVKRAYEWLAEDRIEGKRHAAVLVWRELAQCTPTFFFLQVQQFFDCIFNAVRDPKITIREGAVAALRAALIVTSQRETKESQHPPWYRICLEEAEKTYDDHQGREKRVTRDDWAHGSLLIINELLRCSNVECERVREEMEEVSNPQKRSDVYYKDLYSRAKHQSFFVSYQTTPRKYVAATGAGGRPGVKNKPVLYESRTCRKLISDNYDKICGQVLRHKSSRTPILQQSLLMVLSRLAAFNPPSFVKRYLSDTMNYLIGLLKKDRERSSAFQAIGFLAVAVQRDIVVHLRKIMESIKAALPSKDMSHKKVRSLAVEPAVFTCVSMLCKAVGPEIEEEVRDLLDPMLNTGLSPALTLALKDISCHIPQVKKLSQDGLLKMLSLFLMGRPLRHPGAPPLPPGHALQQSASHPNLGEPQDVATTTLALRTLGSFDFEGHSLTQFVRHCADHYLTSEHREVRLESVKTCSHLLTPLLVMLAAQPVQVSRSAMNVVADVLNNLLVVGITDSESEIRYCVFSTLDERFDPHLAQAENLQALFMALNDEVFEIREMALATIGRLSCLNPAYVMPSLRKVLIQILTELEISGIGRNKEQSARMLGQLVATSPTLIRPYMESVLKVLVPRLKETDPNPSVTIAILAAIGEQAIVSGGDMKPWMDQLLPTIILMMQDSSSLQKREVALWTLGRLVEFAGYVVEPYMKYPNLLDILLYFLKTEQSPGIRREALRVLGLLGALDPYKHKVNLGQVDRSTDTGALAKTEGKQDSAEHSTSEMLVNMSAASLEEYYPAVAIGALMRIIRDPSLSQHHTMVVQAITFIFKSLGIKCVQYLEQVMPAYLNVIRTSDTSFREFLFQQLGVIITIVKQHIRNYLPDIFLLVTDYWTLNSPVQSHLIQLLEQIAMALGTEFKIYLPMVMPQILRVFMHDNSHDRQVTSKLLLALQLFGSNLDEFLHLLLPPIVRLFDASDVPLPVRRTALETMAQLTDVVDMSELASRIIHPLVRALDSTPELRLVAMETLAALVVQLGKKYLIFVPMVTRVVQKHRISHQRYELLLSRLTQPRADMFTMPLDPGDPRSLEDEFGRKRSGRKLEMGQDQSVETATPFKKFHVSAHNLQKAWQATRRVSKDDWVEWLKQLSVELLKESPSPALRSCWALAQNYNPLARDMFNAAFVSCWTELNEQQQDELIQSLEQALTSQDIPEITQTLLNLAEFMEHCDRGPLPLSSNLLGERAMKCRAYAKALHYKEEEFHNGPTTSILGNLISINNKLQQAEAATGVLDFAVKRHRADLKVQETWYEKLHEWDSALVAYERRQEDEPDDLDLLMGRMRCLEALGEWGQLHTLACGKWPLVSDDIRQKMARMAASAAWGLGQWESMEEYTCLIPRDTYDGAFYRAVQAIHQDNFVVAQQCIDKACDILDTDLTAMAGESYNRAYGAMVNVQMLAELEEIIQYKIVPERRTTLKQLWWDRLQGCQRVVEDWQKIIQVRSLVISPQEDMRTWLKYASLCRKSGRLALSQKTMVMLIGCDSVIHTELEPDLTSTHPKLAFAYTKHMWKSNQKQEAYDSLQHLVESLQPQAFQYTSSSQEEKKQSELISLLARCYLKLGDWLTDLEGVLTSNKQRTTDQGSSDSQVITGQHLSQVLQYYATATKHDKLWYKAWHAWAYMNYEALNYYKQRSQDVSEAAEAQAGSAAAMADTDNVFEDQSQFSSKIQSYCIPAVEGFVRSISLLRGRALQDTLRLLTLWFDHGHWPEVYDALVDGLKTIDIDNWLQVIPQLIARIDTPRLLVGKLIHQLLMDIGKQHPQALIYPLTVASKSSVVARQNAAKKVLSNMCESDNTLLQQAILVSEELIRVAILWHEQWHEALEDASRLYFGERNVKGMFAILEPLHSMIERGPQTLKETSFTQAYGRDLSEALEWCRKYQRSNNVKDLSQAWDLYYVVFRRISKQLPQLTSLELQYVSPQLLMCRDLELAVPGTYDPRLPVVAIQHVQSALQVITSKQRPRKLSIFGNDGKEYTFLLKGHEDLRQDERVMQLFGLVNSLLLDNPETFRRNLTIQRFAVIPLSTNSGLIGWVPHCDTLHLLIREYREKKKVLLNIEHRIMQRMAPDYEHLTLMQKVEVFEHALEHTNGDDLAKILWNKSPSSEVWFDRRTNYTRSLAVMSMVGYILGLGDRHPSNLMLGRISGKITHIDFGDCFEVAMAREKFPEKIPFRLTRMLINAMEVTGIDGNYKATCTRVMDVLRNHRDSVLAVLEAFVYDPLLNWKLMDTKLSKPRSGSFSTSADPDVTSLEARPESKKSSTSSAGLYDEGIQIRPEALNKKAIDVVNRVRDKLTGRDFGTEEPVNVVEQVNLLIDQATSHENLCQCYIGWCPFW